VLTSHCAAGRDGDVGAVSGPSLPDATDIGYLPLLGSA